MPKKSYKKPKNLEQTNTNADVRDEKARRTSKSSRSKDSLSCVCGESSRESSEQRKSLVEALIASPILTETSQKSQIKRQKRKNKKQKKDPERQEHVEKVSEIPETVWESVETIKNFEECTAKINEDAIKITEVEVVDDLERELFNSSPLMDEEEEKTLREFLKTLEIVDGQKDSPTKRKKSFSDGNEYEPIEYSSSSTTVVETIPEEIFEEFLENEEIKKTKEAIKSRGVSKTSPRSSPKSKRKTQTSSTKVPPKTLVATSPKMLYSYNGVPFDEPSRKPLVTFEDFDDGIVVINTIRSSPRERHSNRRLDVIIEENSDVSDASEMKSEPRPDKVVKTLVDRRGKIFDDGVKNFDFQMQPVIKETVKIFPLDQNIKESVIIEESEQGNGYSVEPVITETLKMSKDVVKIELPESETENEVEIKREESQNKSQVEIVYLEDDDGELPGDEIENQGIVDASVSSFISDADIKYIEDESESLESSGNRDEGEDGTEADVESELDSRRATCIMEGLDDDFDFDFENPFLPEIEVPSEIKLEPLQNHKPEEAYEEMTETVMSEEKIETKNTAETTELEDRTKNPIPNQANKTEEKYEHKKIAENVNDETAENEQIEVLANTTEDQPRENENVGELDIDVPIENDQIAVLPKDDEENPRMTTDEILCAVQLNLEKLKNSPSYSRQESTSSCASNSYNTAKYLPPYSRSVSEPDSTFKTVSGESLEEVTNDRTIQESFSIMISPLNEEDRTLSEAESLVHDDVSDSTSDFETKMRNNNSKSEIAELNRRGSVKNIVGTMEKNINEILMSKLKVIECFEEPIMSEATWLKVLEMTKREIQTGEAEKLKRLEEDTQAVEPVGIPEKGEPIKRNPDSLSDLAERKMLSLPYGWLVLKKIGLCRCCSGTHQQVDDEIQTKPKVNKKKTENVSFAERRSLSDSDTAAEMKLYNLQCWSTGSPRSVSKTPELWHPPTPPLSPYVEFTSATDKWYGMPVADSDFLLGLSASQKKEFEKRTRKKMPNEREAAFLLDLHQKFLERRCYFEPILLEKDRQLAFDLYPESNFSDADVTKGKRETNDFSKVGGMNEMKTEGARKFEIEKKSRLVGNGRFLAISQNATSDDFVPELNINSSVGSSCESHEVSLVQNQAAMFNIWQKQRKFGSTSKNYEEVCGENNDFSGKQHHMPNKPNKQDDDLLVMEERDNPCQKGISSGFRPKMIGSEDDKDVYINHDKFLKEYRNSKKIVQEMENNRQENQVITEKLPTVSDIIKNFESTDMENNQNPLKLIAEKYHISKKGDIALIQNGENGYDRRRIQDLIQKERRKSVPTTNLSDGELFKQKMYEEYMSKLAERVERRQQKAIKMSQTNEIESPEEPKFLDIENEFINKVKERNDKLKLMERESANIMFESFEKKCQEFTTFWEGQYSDLESLRKNQVRRRSCGREESDKGSKDNTPETASSKRSSIQLILDTTSDVAGLPKHLQEFLRIEEDDLSDVKIDFQSNRKGRKVKSAEHCSNCKKQKDNLLKEIDDALVVGKGFLFSRGSTMFTPTFKATAPRPGIWSPAQPPPEEKPEEKEENEERKKLEDEPIPPIWTPKSAQASPVAERKEFRPVNFESPTLPRKKYIQEVRRSERSAFQPVDYTKNDKPSAIPPWQQPGGDRTPDVKTPGSPGLSLPRAPNPTVTLLQKAREGHLPRGAHYLNNNMNDSYSDSEHRIHRNEVFYSSREDSERPRKVEIIPKLPVHGIGPTTKEGIPVVLRSEVTEENKEKWYKRMYESLHKAGKDEDYVTVKYRTSPSRKGGFGYQPGSSSGYQSEPENLVYDSNRQVNKYQTLDRRRSERDKENDYISVTLPRSRASTPRYETYKNQPGRIENYEPGHSSISELEAKQWWDEVLEIFDRWLERNPDAQGPGARKLLTDAFHRRRQEERSVPVHKTESPKSFMTYALRDAGYLNDPQHVIKRRDENFQSSLSPQEQKEAYKIIQKGGEVPLRGLRKPAPERPKDDTEIEYFPLSPTLTRIRVHKQNITPLSEFPFLTFPVSYQTTTFNYPNYPIGVCNSFSQVQIFPPPPPPPAQQSKKKKLPETVYTKKGSHYQFSRNPDLLKKDQKFSVQLQNISGVDDYIQIVPQQRSASKKVHDYVNLPLRSQSCSPRPWSPKREISPLSFCSKTCETSYKRTVSPESRTLSPVPVFPSRGNICGSLFTPEQKKPELATFSDLKRIAPSIVPKTIPETPLFGKVIHNKPKERKENENKSTGSNSIKKSESVKSRSDSSNSGEKDKSVKKQSVKKSVAEKIRKIPERKVLVSRNRISPDKKVQDVSKKSAKLKSKVPLSESVQREKPLSKTHKRFKTISSKDTETKKTFKTSKKDQSDSDKSSLDRSKQDILDYLSRFVESQLGSGYIELQSSEENNTESCTVEESGKETDGTMNPIYDSVNPNFGVKRKVEPDITEAFRSRSFSPDVRKKLVKPPDKNVPVPPKRKSSKNNSTLRMWSKMMVSYPYHRSRLDTFDSNVKFLRDRLRRRLDRGIEDKENESEFGDDIETVRTVRRDKNGSMSIKTNRYVKISRPISSPVTPTRTYDEHGRRVISEPRTKTDTSEPSKARRLSDASTVSKSTDIDVKRTPSKPKGLDTVVRSSTTYSVRNPANQEEDKRKSVKVTVAISSKGKEVLRKSASLSSPKKGFAPTKSSSSPCPSISSYRSGLSGRSLLSEKGSSTSSPGRGTSPQSRVLSPNSSISRVSSPSRSVSPGSTIISEKQKGLKSRTEIKSPPAKKLVPVQSNAPITMTFSGSKDSSKSDKKFGIKKLKETVKASTITKSPGKRLLAQMSSLTKSSGSKEDLKKKGKKTTKSGDLDKKLKKNGSGKTKISNEKKKKIEKKSDRNGRSDEIKNEVIEGTNLVRTDSFFQNLFLRGPPDKKPVANVERTSSVLERARNYQRSIERPLSFKSEPSLALVTFYLAQKKPVSSSKFKSYDRELSLSRSPSPFMGSRSQSFQMKLRQFDHLGDERDFASLSPRGTSPDIKIRSASEPPINRSQTNSPEDLKSGSRVAISDAGSIGTSPTPSRSPSCRRIQSFKSSLRSIDSGRDVRKKCVRARSAGGVDDLRPSSFLGAGSSLAQSTSSLNLSNLSDHAEYQAYVLELMHSTKKCERFRELHKFYSSLERMGELEKTASIGDLRPRMKNEEIIDYDRWKKLRTKERAEAELKMLVGKLTEIQKEKDLVFRTADVEAVRWKGDRGLRIKERSVEDLREQFYKYAQEEACSDLSRKRDITSMKDNYKPLWRGSSIVNLATNLNTTMASHRGRPVTIEDLQKIEAAKERIAKKLGTKGIASYTWSSLSNDQVHALKNQLTEIYGQELKKKGFGFDGGIPENYEITVPEDGDMKSPGEKNLYVRCNSLLTKDQTYAPSVRKKEKIREETKKAESISALPNWKSKTETEANDRKVGLLELPWKDELKESDFTRTQSEIRSGKNGRHPPSKSRSSSSTSTSKPLSESEKKRLSMTLSKEVLEKITKPREILGATGGKAKKSGTVDSNEGTGSPRTCYSLEMSEDGKSKSDFLLVLTPTEKGKDVEKVVEEWANGNSCRKESDRSDQKLKNAVSTTELESVSASSETSVKTVIAKNSVDVLKKVEYYEDLSQNPEEDPFLEETKKIEVKKMEAPSKSGKKKSSEKKKTSLTSSRSFENLKELLGQERKYATIPFQRKQVEEAAIVEEKKPTEAEFVQIKSKSEEFQCLKKLFEDQIRFHSASPIGYRSIPSVSSNDSVFSFRSRSVSPDPTKYYRAYLRMVKCGAVRKLCNKFESWEDLICSSDKDSWLPPTPKRFASDPELTRDMLRRYGTDPTKVTVRGQEVGDVRWLRTKYEKNSDNPRGRSRYRRGRVASPVLKNPICTSDRFMPRINVISKTAELQLQKLNPDYGKRSPDSRTKDIPLPSRYRELAASPEPYRSLIDYTKEHGGYYYTGEVEKLRRKFEKLHDAEKLSILGQMYTSTPEVNELRDIAPYLGCSWVAHRYPGVTKTASSPELNSRRQESCKNTKTKERPHSSSPIRPKQPCSILKPSYPYPDKDFFADQKYDPSIHRPKYRYQPDVDLDRRSKRGDPDHTWWKNWSKPTVTFKEPVDFDFLNQDQNIRDLTPDSARKYVESEVTIHYKSPVRAETKAYLSEEELARRQAESMKRIYQEERRRKYLQELQDMNSRRHTDNFTPSQKSPISLHRYDDFPFDHSSSYSPTRFRDSSSEPVLVARGLYDFAGRRPRELAFRRGDVIFIIRRLDKNWCEGELNGAVGLFPLSYVEIIPYNEVNPKYGRARAKYDFIPQTSLELLARKGDMITLIRRIDDNWFEGRIGERTGIIPTSYCHVMVWPRSTSSRLLVRQEKSKPVASPAAHSLIHNGKVPTKHSYIPWFSGPNSPGPSTASSAASGIAPDGHTNINHRYGDAHVNFADEDFATNRPNKTSAMQPLNISINPRSEPALYQVLFNHIPNNDDELELVQGETVLVVEKCEDGWYVGSNPMTGKIGIFPGNHVRRMSPEFV